MEKENIVLKKAYLFALRIIKLYQYLVKKKKEYILSRQILKAGTSIVANLEEAMGGISRVQSRKPLNQHFIKIILNSSFLIRNWLGIASPPQSQKKNIFNS